MSGPTPGPWVKLNGTDVFTRLGSPRADGLCADDNDGWQIADCQVGVTFINGEEKELPFAEQCANARLIAAAPELLEALLRVMPFVDDAEDIHRLFPESACSKQCREAVRLCRTAIAAATGETP